jgi:hypothetical protein
VEDNFYPQDLSRAKHFCKSYFDTSPEVSIKVWISRKAMHQRVPSNSYKPNAHFTRLKVCRNYLKTQGVACTRACLGNTRLVLLGDVHLTTSFCVGTRSGYPSSGSSISIILWISPRLGSTWLVFRITRLINVPEWNALCT